MKTKLSRAAKIIYGAGDLGFSLTSTIVGAYFLFFLTDMVQIKPAVAGIAILIGKTWDYLTAWRHSRKHPKSAAIKSVLVLPEYWGSGVAILMFSEMAKALLAKGYDWADLSLTSADNPRTPVLAERIGAKIYKRYCVYRLTF